MTREEAKTILLLYRFPADAEDPQVAEALTLARTDAELADWFRQHCGRQEGLRQAFREIAVPAGLKEKILAAQSRTRQKKASWMDIDLRVILQQPRFALPLAAIVIAAAILTPLWFHHKQTAQVFAIFQNQMVGVALRGYDMNLATNKLEEVRRYLAKNGAPADYVLPPAIEKMETTGCAIEQWNGKPVSMICLRTGRPLPPGQQNDLWLFVMDRNAAKDFPLKALPQFSNLDGLTTAYWVQGDKFYFLGTQSDAETLRSWL